jgi:hypothetical protein
MFWVLLKGPHLRQAAEEFYNPMSMVSYIGNNALVLTRSISLFRQIGAYS